MDDINFIKWMCEKAEGFRHIENMNDIEGPDQMYIGEYLIVKDNVRWPLLLQRAIEGVNREYYKTGSGTIIEQSMSFIAVGTDHKIEREFLFDHKSITIDQAKESALLYIYEQEKK